MARYKIKIEYDGTAYSGWQRQPNAPTVEQTLEEALSRVLQEPVDVIGQGRTDSGVHAEAQVAHFDTAAPVNTDDLCYAMLGVLPRDISLWEMRQVPDDFHARFHGLSRQYRYQVVTRPSALHYRYAAYVPRPLDWEAMRRCAAMIRGEHDFDGFSKIGDDQQDAICTVLHSQLQRQDHLITYRIRANRFVRHMVRRLVGSMLLVGQGRWTEDHFRCLLTERPSGKQGHGAPAKGLILEKVEYEDFS